MNAAVTAALLAAKQSGELPDVVSRLTEAGAVSIDKAIVFEPRTDAEAEQRDELISKGLIQRRSDGRIFVNKRAVDERNARQGYAFLIVLVILLSVAASTVALLTFA